MPLQFTVPRLYFFLYRFKVKVAFLKKNIACFFLINCLFLSRLDLHCWAWAFLQSWRAGDPLQLQRAASHRDGCSCRRAWALGTCIQQLWSTSPVAPQHVGSSQTRDQTHVPCTGRQSLNHWTTREVPKYHILRSRVYSLLSFY